MRKLRIKLADPIEVNTREQAPLAERTPAALRRTWGFIDTGKMNADVFISELRRMAEQDFGVQTLCVRKNSPGVSITDEVANDIARRCGVVVACFGD